MKEAIINLLAIIFLCQLYDLVTCVEHKPSGLQWPRPGVLSQPSFHLVLSSIEERLRGLETIRYNSERWDNTLDTMTRKLGALESRMSLVQRKLDELAQRMNTHDLNNEIIKDAILSKYDVNQERVIARLSFIEGRVENTANKLQSTMHSSFEQVKNKQNDVLHEMNHWGRTLEQIRTSTHQMDSLLNATEKSALHLSQRAYKDQAISRQLDQIFTSLQDKQLSKKIIIGDNTEGSNAVDSNKLINSIKTEITNEAERLGAKVNSMHDEVTRKLSHVEQLARECLFVGNLTREQMQDFVQDQRDIEAQDSYSEYITDSWWNTIQQRLEEIGLKIDLNYVGIEEAQKKFSTDCYRIQEKETQIETKVSIILEKILDMIVNRGLQEDKHQSELLQVIKDHGNQVIRTVTHTTNTVVKLAHKNSEEHSKIGSRLANLTRLTYNYINPPKDKGNTTSTQEENDKINIYNVFEKKEPQMINKGIQTEEIIIKTDNATNPETNKTVQVTQASYNQGVVKIVTELQPEIVIDSKDNETKVSDLNSTLAVNNISAIVTESMEEYIESLRESQNMPQSYVKEFEDWVAEHGMDDPENVDNLEPDFDKESQDDLASEDYYD